MANGLAIDTSDMDLLVSGIFSEVETLTRFDLVSEMNKVFKKVSILPFLRSFDLIDTATIPVIKLVRFVLY